MLISIISDVSCGLYEQKCISLVSQYPLHAFMSRCLDFIATELKTSSASSSSLDLSGTGKGGQGDGDLIAPKIVSKLLLPVQCQLSSWIVFKYVVHITVFFCHLVSSTDKLLSSFPMLQIYTDVAIFIGDFVFIHKMFSENIVKVH